MLQILGHLSVVFLGLFFFEMFRESDLFFRQKEEEHLPPACIRDYAELAKRKLPPAHKHYLFNGAAEGLTIRDNVCAYRKWALQRRLLVNVNGYDNIETRVLGHKLAAPLGISPSAFNMLYHPDGEVAVARAAQAAGLTLVLSAFSSVSLEDIRSTAPDLNLWQMLYLFDDRAITLSYIKRAEAASCSALVITIDKSTPSEWYWRKQHDSSVLFKSINASANGGGYTKEELKKAQNPADTPTWEELAWVVKQTRLPVVAKGILSGHDAKMAAQAGVKGVFISNHGGRVLDGVPATVDVLEEIVAAVQTTGVEVYIDGGIKTGMDAFRALALGADAVFVGRAPLYGLAHGGQAGVTDVLNILVSELKNTLGLVGVTSIANVTSDMVRKRPDGPVVTCHVEKDYL